MARAFAEGFRQLAALQVRSVSTGTWKKEERPARLQFTGYILSLTGPPYSSVKEVTRIAGEHW